MSKTLAIVIGISKYKSKLFGTLPGADADTRRVRQSLTSWGVHPDNILFLNDQKATRQAILRALRVWPLQKASKDIRIIMFFAKVFFARSANLNNGGLLRKVLHRGSVLHRRQAVL